MLDKYGEFNLNQSKKRLKEHVGNISFAKEQGDDQLRFIYDCILREIDTILELDESLSPEENEKLVYQYALIQDRLEKLPPKSFNKR